MYLIPDVEMDITKINDIDKINSVWKNLDTITMGTLSSLSSDKREKGYTCT